MKILVTGDRNWSNYWKIRKALTNYGATIVVHGAAPGADTVADNAARDLALERRPYPANWKDFGRRAGPIRNRLQFNTEKPDLVLAFRNNLEESRGTKDMVDYALSKGAKVILISEHMDDVELTR